MKINRRDLVKGGLAVGSLFAISRDLLGGADGPRLEGRASYFGDEGLEWEQVRRSFLVSDEYIHMAGFLLASHPAPVREAIAKYRDELDRNPALFEMGQAHKLECEVRQAAAAYLGSTPDLVALTDSTTMGLALLYQCVKIRADQEVLTTEHDHYSTHQSLALRKEHNGCSIRTVRLFEDSAKLSRDEVVHNLLSQIRPNTRVVAVTWVHSSTGVKLPIQELAAGIAQYNVGREDADRILFCVDGVHGFGSEAVQVAELGCDFFAAGCHKWLLGPRGTGVLWGRSAQAWQQLVPLIPSFSGWGRDEKSLGELFTPGGFHSFEHRWALTEAFKFHKALGPARISTRIHSLNRRLKEGLLKLPRVKLYTPLSEEFSSGIVCFDVEGKKPDEVVKELLERHKIIATKTPYKISYARLSCGLLNNEQEVDRTIEAVAGV